MYRFKSLKMTDDELIALYESWDGEMYHPHSSLGCLQIAIIHTMKARGLEK